MGIENHWAIPGEADSESGRAVEQEAMQSGTADADAAATGKVGGDAGLVGGESDAGEFRAVMRFEMDAELDKGAVGFRHQAFAAGFVDGRAESVGDEDVGAALAQGDGSGQAGGSSADDEYVTGRVT
jgi:hypothetical protein